MVVVVTGGSQGQGEAEARLFAEAGARVFIADVADESGEGVAAEIGASYCHVDVSNATAWRDLMVKVMDAHGRLDVLVNNAAVHWFRSIEEETVEDFDRLIGVNLRGTFLGIKAALAPMRASNGGSIINIASIAGIRGFPLHASYGASKWAIRGLTKTAAAELGPSGIRVNVVLPGTIDSPMAWGGGPMPAGISFDHLAAWPGGRGGRGGACGGLPRLECFRLHYWQRDHGRWGCDPGNHGATPAMSSLAARFSRSGPTRIGTAQHHTKV